MNEWEFETYERMMRESARMHVAQVGYRQRTLAYGYTVERDEWHAYVEDGELHVVVYGPDGAKPTLISYDSGESLPYDDLRPGKRAYPDATDMEFAVIMAEHDRQLTFLGSFTWDSPTAVMHREFAAAHDGYYGLRARQLRG